MDNDLLDELVSKIGENTVSSIEEFDKFKNLSQKEKIEYVCRAYSEILSILIVSAPKNEVQKICNQICGFLQNSVARNIAMTESFGFSLNETFLPIETVFKDNSIFISKKAKA